MQNVSIFTLVNKYMYAKALHRDLITKISANHVRNLGAKTKMSVTVTVTNIEMLKLKLVIVFHSTLFFDEIGHMACKLNFPTTLFYTVNSNSAQLHE
jgi:hypothetical protein